VANGYQLVGNQVHAKIWVSGQAAQNYDIMMNSDGKTCGVYGCGNLTSGTTYNVTVTAFVQMGNNMPVELVTSVGMAKAK
jgi:hypothetical protein